MRKKIKNNPKLQTSDFRLRGGFTLIELLVAMAIFLIAVIVVAQIFSAGMGGVKRLFGRQNALDAARFVLESMSREIRMSDVLTGVGGPVGSIDIKNSKDCNVTYAFSGTAVTRQVTAGAGCLLGLQDLSSNDVEVTGSFRINVAVAEQKRVTVVTTVKNKTTILAQQVQVNLQTTISSRQYGPPAPPPPPTCTSWTYSAWGACQSNNMQYRTILTSSPPGCTGGSPILSQPCVYVPPPPSTPGVCGPAHSYHWLFSYWGTRASDQSFFCSYNALPPASLAPSWPPGYFEGIRFDWRCYNSDLVNWASCWAYRDSLLFVSPARTRIDIVNINCWGTPGWLSSGVNLNPLNSAVPIAAARYTTTVTSNRAWLVPTVAPSNDFIWFDVNCAVVAVGACQTAQMTARATIPTGESENSNVLSITICR